MTKAYNLSSADDARQELLALAKELETINPSAARSLHEGLEETLMLHQLGVPEALRKSLQSTKTSLNRLLRSYDRHIETSNAGETANRSNAGSERDFWKRNESSGGSKGTEP